MSAKHTVLLLYSIKYEDHYRLNAVPAFPIARTHGDSQGDMDDAARLVLCWNAHDELVAALKAYELLDDKHANCEECEGESAPELCTICFPFADDARCKMRAALAKAGEP
jgi:hypothetical protein